MSKQQDHKAKGAFDRQREGWQKQLIADPMIRLGALKVAIAISHHFNRDDFVRGKGLVAFPGITTLAKLTGLHRTTVMSSVRWLKARGHFRVDRDDVKNRANHYHPLYKAVAELNEIVGRKTALLPSSVAALPS